MKGGSGEGGFWAGWMPVAFGVLLVGLAIWLVGYYGMFSNAIAPAAADKLSDLGAGILSGGLVTAAFVWTDERNQARHEAQLLRLQLGMQADLTGLHLKKHNLDDMSLAGKCLKYASLAGCSLKRTSFVRADLAESDLSGSTLQGAQLMSATLTGANLLGADLRDADLTGASLKSAACVGTDFSGADLTDADLEGADLSGADFTNAKVSPQQLGRARVSDSTRLPRVLSSEGGE